MRDELQRRVVGPVQVVEYDHDRSPCGKALQQEADGSVSAEPLVAQHRLLPASGGPDARQHPRELDDAVSDEAFEPVVADRAHVVVEGVDPHAEGHVALELRSAPGEDEMSTPRGGARKLRQQPGLADARTSVERKAARLSARQRVERMLKRPQLKPAPDQRSVSYNREIRLIA